MKNIKLNLNKKKFEIFLEVAKELNKEDIVPILYGSLGLCMVIGEFKEASDIDFLVPGNIITKDWRKAISLMEKIRFNLKDEKEHEFERENKIVAFGNEKDLKDMSNINPEEIKVTEINGVKFRELSPEQYLCVYEFMLRDGYRQEKRGKDDQEKISLIKNYLEKNKIEKEQEYLNGWKRAQADFENYKKQQSQAQKDFARFASQDLIMQILPVLDNFHASTGHIPEGQKNDPWVVGIMHIQKQLENVLKENGVEEMEVKEGDEFDPEIHEAVKSDANDTNEHPNGTNKISKVLSKGYKIGPASTREDATSTRGGEKVIRPAKVIVS